MAWRGNEMTNGTYTVLANRQKDTFVHGFLDVSGSALITGNLVVGSSGKVGIGSTNPVYTLDVSSASTQPFRVGIGATNAIVVNSTGLVGIGTNNPICPLHVVGGVSVSLTYGYLNGSGTTGTVSNMASNISIRAENRVVASEFNATSDRRIKKDINDIDDNVSLELLRKFRPRTFKFVDHILNSNLLHYGFIGQELKEVLNESVHLDEDYVTNIFDPADVINGNIIKLKTKSTSLFVTDPSNLLLKLYDASNNEIETTILNIIDDTTFEIANNIDMDSVFVYGQKVKDFHTIDANAVFAITTSAVQAIDHIVQSEKAKVAILETQLTDVLARLSVLENK